MAGIIRAHHPTLAQEEREHRMEQIKKATIQFYMETRDERKDRNFQSRDSIRGVPTECICNGQ